MEVLSIIAWQAFAVFLICGGVRLTIFIFEVVNDCFPQTCRTAVTIKTTALVLGLLCIIIPGVVHGLTNLPAHGIVILFALRMYILIAVITMAWSYKRPPKL